MTEQYQGNPANDPIAITVIDDTDDWTAANLNLAPEGLADSIANHRARIGGGGGSWWGGMKTWTTQAGFSNFTPGLVFWDSALGRWLTWGLDYPTLAWYILQSYDGETWNDWTGNLDTLLGQTSGTVQVQGVVPDPSTGECLILAYYAGSVNAGKTVVVSATGGVSAGVTGPWTNSGAGWYVGSRLPSGEFFVFATQATSSPWFGGTGTSWTSAATWAPPASFESHATGGFWGNWGGTYTICVMPQGSTVVSAYMYSTDAQHYAQGVMPTFLLTNEEVIDACLDVYTGYAYILSGTSGGTQCHVWASAAAGTAWTLVSTINRACYSIAAANRTLAIWAKYPGQGPSLAAIYRPIISTDAGQTWSAPTGIGDPAAPVINTVKIVASVAGQFLYSNSGGIGGGGVFAASGFGGGPPAGVI